MAGNVFRVLLAASVIGGFWPVGQAAAEAGKAVAVVQSATVTGRSGRQTLKVGMPVSLGDRIKTDTRGQAQLLFTDDTKLVVGPNSSLVIESYLLSSGSTVNKFAVKALGGSFRFITGKSAKSAYAIKTPAATIGIRGTSFDLTVGRSGDASIVVFTGEAEICGNGGCVRLKDACSLANAPRRSDVNMVRSQRQRSQQIRERFPYIVSQAPLRRDFRVSTRSCGNLEKAILKSEPRVTGTIRKRERGEPARQTEAGNPGNAGPMGNAGPNPGGNNLGAPVRGRSDALPN